MDQAIRNKLRSVVTQCRRLLEESIAQQLQGRYDIYATGKKDEVRAEKEVPLEHLTDEERQARRDILAHFEHVKALGYRPREALEQLIREIAFTHLNRLCAYKMMEVRDVYVGGQRFRESVSKGLKSQGFLFYLADHAEDERRFNAGQQEEAYRHFLNWLGGTLSQEIGVLFSPTDPANRVYPPQRVLDEVLDLLNSEELKGIWSEDETIGWVYQYFTPKELRDQARKESQAPRNSYELAFRNQFFTPRYVVEFLTDNTLGRIWYEMRRGNTRLKDECRYMVRRPTEVFLLWDFGDLGDIPQFWDAVTRGEFGALPETATWDEINPFALLINGYEEAERHGLGDCGEFANALLEAYRETGEWEGNALELWCCLFFEQRRWRHFGYEPQGEDFGVILALYQALRRELTATTDGLGQDELLKRPVFIPIRPTKDPREIKILDPACGSGHFLLYCFALLLVIYEEAFDDPDLGPGLQADYPTKDDLRRAIPGLILRHNLHGIDIDLRCTQIAALALWLRCQRAYQEMGLKKDRPPILKANVVCAEPMPGEEGLLDEFLKTLREDRLEALIRQVMNVPEDQRVRATRGMVESLSELVRTVWDKMRLAGEAGSLLKIEDELQDAIRRGQEQWEERLPLFRFTEYGLSEEPKERMVRFVPGDVEGQRVTFWDKAESLVRRALDEFVEYASNGGSFQRQLFVEDAKQGLGFVDVCQQIYDVVLMNPPFGDASARSLKQLGKQLAASGRDIGSTFVSAANERWTSQGFVGTVLSSSPLFHPTFSNWRHRQLLGQSGGIKTAAHLGGDVLDGATVSASALIISKTNGMGSVFFRLIRSFDKVESLQSSVFATNTGGPSQYSTLCNPKKLSSLPGSPLAYWISGRLLDQLCTLPAFEGNSGTVKVGIQTSDEFRFVRAWWEVELPSKKWISYSKTSEYSPFWDDATWVLNFEQGGEEIISTGRAKIQGISFFGRLGITFPRRSVLGFNPRIHPEGSAFGDSGPVAFPDRLAPAALLGLLTSRPAEYALSLFVGSLQGEAGSHPLHYEVGVMQRLPFPELSDDDAHCLASNALRAVMLLRGILAKEETSRDFVKPQVLVGATLKESASLSYQSSVDAMNCLVQVRQRSDLIAISCFKFSESDVQDMEREFAERIPPSSGLWRIYFGLAPDLVDYNAFASSALSVVFGYVMGRWDIRRNSNTEELSENSNPFSPPTPVSPGMLKGPDGLPAKRTPNGYPLSIDSDGILVDDPDHTGDIIRRVRDVLEVIWGDQADAIEKEACEILGVADLRDYFRKPGPGGFWDDHIKRYSKSRRKAPIYRLLQSSKKNYALWLYYHRLDRDILFKALLHYVEPKIRREEARLGELRSQKAALGPAAKGAKKLDKDIDRQEAFLSELRDFEDKLRRAANLHLDPDLNDGVVLNIAPLHELVPWKEARSYWNDLIDGKYEWSSIGKQLREKGLVPSQAP